MKRRWTDILSVLCCIAGLAYALVFLVVGICSIRAKGWGRLGVIYIPPSTVIIVFAIVDLLTLFRRKGLAWSWFSTIIKCLCIGLLARALFFDFPIFVAASIPILVIAFPSIWNIIRLRKLKRDSARKGEEP